MTPGGHRRVLRQDLIHFMEEFGMPIPADLKEPSHFALIVDDEKDVIELLTTVLQSGEEEIEVVGAQSGVEALLIIGERKPDLLVLDIMMPGMNGLEVCEKLRAGAGTRNLNIIAVSGDHDPELRRRILAAGADLFFTKPFDMIAFRDQALELMHSPRGR